QKYDADTCKIVEYATPEKCFEFDANTGTITKYKKSDLDCPMDVVIPDTIGGTTVKVIGEYAFLENIDGNSEPTEGDSRYINSVVLPSGLEEIGVMAFLGKCSDTIIFNQLTNIDFSRATKLQTIGVDAFLENQLTSVDFSALSSLQTIEYGAFALNQLTSIEIPPSVTNIGIV
ncbi:MAG: leucine-rich repeat domain-containing protein, partial [Bacilli bacterium]